MSPSVIARPTKMAARAAWYRLNGRADEAVRLEEALVAVGRCRRCGRTLTDPDSLSRGIGPDCIKRSNPSSER